MKTNAATSIQDIQLSAILDTFVNRTESLIGPHLVRVILYGSYAKGSNDDESDIDILLLVDADVNKIRMFDEALDNLSFELSLASDILINAIILENNHFHNYLDVLPFYTNIDNEGIVLYE